MTLAFVNIAVVCIEAAILDAFCLEDSFKIATCFMGRVRVILMAVGSNCRIRKQRDEKMDNSCPCALLMPRFRVVVVVLVVWGM